MENNLDKLFKSKLEGQEPEFHPAAWDRMEGILDREGLSPAVKKKYNRSRIIYLSFFFITLFSGVGYFMIESNQNFGEGSSLVDSINVPTTNSAASNHETSRSHESVDSKSNLATDSKTSIDSPNLNSVSKTTKSTNTNSSTHFTSQNKQIQYDNKSTHALSSESVSNGTHEVSINKYTATDALSSEGESALNEKNLKPQLTERSNLLNLLSENGNILDNDGKENKASLVSLVNQTSGNTSNENNTKESEIIRSQSTLPIIEMLKTRADNLEYKAKIIQPQIQKINVSKIELGMLTLARFNQGNGYSFGPYLSYRLGNGVSMNMGSTIDIQRFNQGPSVNVYDKIYSFGSTVTERTFSLNSQTSVSIPLSIQKSFGRFGLSAGISVNKILASKGSIAVGSEVQEASVRVENDMLRPIAFNFQVGGSVSLNRYFDLNFGLEYRQRSFLDDDTVVQNSNNYYPTVGLKYKLFKF